MKATAVIGANFGDEGKGLMTDYFSSSDSLVIRYNGGAQAGHTVVSPDSKRHIFSHFGSGSFAGAATFLSRYFVINPMLWKKELKTLKEIGIHPNLYYSKKSFVTLPYDMLINQEVEKSKGNNRHGSCGMGINETITRCSTIGNLSVIPDKSFITDSLKENIVHIRDNYCLERIKQLGLNPSKEFFDIFNSNNLLDNFINDIREFIEENFIACEEEIVQVMKPKDVIFEGAQGLLLDEDHEFFPHVTRSKTGLKNVLALCEDMGINNLDAVYVTRAYMTRHGRGPFPSEDKNLSYKDTTNIHNEFQEGLRFGRLDVDILAKSIENDLQQTYKSKISVSPRIAITHVDQIPSNVSIDYEYKTVDVPGYDELIQIISRACNVLRVFVSTGSRRKDIATMLVTKDKLHV